MFNILIAAAVLTVVAVAAFWMAWTTPKSRVLACICIPLGVGLLVAIPASWLAGSGSTSAYVFWYGFFLIVPGTILYSLLAVPAGILLGALIRLTIEAIKPYPFEKDKP